MKLDAWIKVFKIGKELEFIKKNNVAVAVDERKKIKKKYKKNYVIYIKIRNSSGLEKKKNGDFSINSRFSEDFRRKRIFREFFRTQKLLDINLIIYKKFLENFFFIKKRVFSPAILILLDSKAIIINFRNRFFI